MCQLCFESTKDPYIEVEVRPDEWYLYCRKCASDVLANGKVKSMSLVERSDSE